MKEWDQNDLGKGAKINLPAIQQSVIGKAFPDSNSSFDYHIKLQLFQKSA